MFAFIPRSLCALKRVVAKADTRYEAMTGIQITVKKGLCRADATDGRRALIVHCQQPEDMPWPGFKDHAEVDDAYHAVISPKDLERACKMAETGLGALAQRYTSVGLATVSGARAYLGLGEDVLSTMRIEGRFPDVTKVIPAKKPICSVRINPRSMAELLLAIDDLVHDDERGVTIFFYGHDTPLGICARNPEQGMLIDALLVPLVTQSKATPPSTPPARPTTATPNDAKQPINGNGKADNGKAGKPEVANDAKK